MDDYHWIAINSEKHCGIEREYHQVVLQRLFEEEVTKDLFTILGHLVLLWFTGNTQEHIQSELGSDTVFLQNNATKPFTNAKSLCINNLTYYWL